MDLENLIESEFDMFKDRHTDKRGPRHRRDGAGLNLNRKHQNLIADVHKADPNVVNELERLRKLPQGRGFVNFKVGEQLKQKYGLLDDSGFLGTTGIKMVKTPQGYQLIKEAVVKVEGRRYAVNNPDDIWAKVPGTHVAFSIMDGIVYYLVGVGDRHIDILDKVLTNSPTTRLQAFPKPSKAQVKKLVMQAQTYGAQFRQTATGHDLEDWGKNGNPRVFFELSGRCILVKENGVAAFWNKTEKVNEYVKLLRAFFVHIGADPDPAIVTLDNKDTKLGRNDPPNGPVGRGNDTRTMLRQQHFVPLFKKLLGAKSGSAQKAQKASSAGFSSPAAFNAAHVIGDSVNA